MCAKNSRSLWIFIYLLNFSQATAHLHMYVCEIFNSDLLNFGNIRYVLCKYGIYARIFSCFIK